LRQREKPLKEPRSLHNFFIMKRFYFDYAATTPIDSEVLKEINSNLRNNFGNPGSLHYFGQKAMASVDKSREIIAKALGANFREIIFTGSATEANNLALRGVVKFFQSKKKSPLRIIISSIEHESVLETARDLEKEGAEIIYLKVNKNGIVDLEQFKKYLNERTVLVSIMYANNETGTIQPITEIAEIIKKFKEKKYPKPYTLNPIPYFHTDAVQAFQFLDCNVKNLGVDLMTVSGHKIYGPKGIGALYVKDNKLNPSGYWLSPVITGGGQEFDLRSGTENASIISGFAKAIELAVKNKNSGGKRLAKLSDYFYKEIKKIVPSAQLNASKAERLPNILNISFIGENAENLLIKFDLAGISVSRGSACSARSSSPSRVLKSMGLQDKEINSSLRFSFGKFTAKKDIDEGLKIIKIIFQNH